MSTSVDSVSVSSTYHILLGKTDETNKINKLYQNRWVNEQIDPTNNDR